MTRKKKLPSKDHLQAQLTLVKLRTERVKLKTLEYELKIAADKKRTLAGDKEHKKTMEIMDMKDEFFMDTITTLQDQVSQLRAELAKLRRAQQHLPRPK